MAQRDLRRALSDLAEQEAGVLDRPGAATDAARRAVAAGRKARRPARPGRPGAVAIAAAAVAAAVSVAIAPWRQTPPHPVHVQVAAPPTGAPVAAPRTQLPPVRRHAPAPTIVTVAGWDITAVPPGETLEPGSPSPASPTLVDFLAGPDDSRPAACRTKPALAVTVLTEPGGLHALEGTPGPRVSGHRVLVEGSDPGDCPGEVLIIWSPARGVDIQVATTGGGLPAALLVARGIHRA